MISSIIPRNILPTSGEASAATTVTGPASQNTKGSWTQLIASTARRTLALTFTVDLTAAVADTVFDIGVGAGGVEVVVIPDLRCFSSGTHNQTTFTFTIPFSIPAGSRIAARLANTENATAQSAVVGLTLHQE